MVVGHVSNDATINIHTRDKRPNVNANYVSFVRSMFTTIQKDCDTEHIVKSSKRKEQLNKAYLMWKQNLTPVKQAQRYESNNKQKKLTRDAGKSQEKNFECPKCSNPFVYPGHVKRCACK